MWTVEQVAADRQRPALSLIAGPGARRHGPDGLDALGEYLRDQGDSRLWWAIDGVAPLAAAASLHAPGRTATLLFGPAKPNERQRPALAAVLDAAAAHALTRGAVLVQGLAPVEAAGARAAFASAGFDELAELIYMRLLVRGRSVTAPPAEVAFESYHPASDKLFRGAIEASYVDSLDCPGLEGLRNIDDVLAGHMSSGLFRPGLWQVLLLDGVPAGVILLNEAEPAQSLEVVYMGVGGDYRGRGLGRVLIQRAIALAQQHGFRSITLAVDAGNPYAHRLYEGAGFAETNRRIVLIRAGGKTKIPG